MGSYGMFVWPSFGAVIVLLSVLGFTSWKRKIDDEKTLNELRQELENLSDQDE